MTTSSPAARDPAERLEPAFALIRQRIDGGTFQAVSLIAGHAGQVVGPFHFGRTSTGIVNDNSLFLVASLTKPITATAVLQLVEQGRLTLDDPVAGFLPDFQGEGKRDVRIRHLLTHTSGLPDMAPNNLALRAAHAPFSAFINEAMRVKLLFPPGTAVHYQSLGFALLAEIVQKVTGQTLAAYLEARVFQPLGMSETSLGSRPASETRIVPIRLEESSNRSWNWNSSYWLRFGAPWGGLISSASDLAKVAVMMLNEGKGSGARILSRASVKAMTRNQLEAMPNVPEVDRRCRPWGLGWRLNWPGHSPHFGDLLGPRAFGHWGSTGTLCWVDPDSRSFLVLLTNQPVLGDDRRLAAISNSVAAALSSLSSRGSS